MAATKLAGQRGRPLTRPPAHRECILNVSTRDSYEVAACERQPHWLLHIKYGARQMLHNMAAWLLPVVAGTSCSVPRPALHAALVHGMQSALLALLLVRSNTC